MTRDQISSARPVLLEAALTPPSRTPWGGARIRVLKGLPAGPRVGEAWELSVEPSFPSRVADGGLLAERLAEDPAGWLGAERERGGTALLVKLLDAGDALSMQIHPADDYAGLAPHESGKPESWYVVAREEGAGLRLGLSPDASPERVTEALARGEDISAFVPFVPVEPGDFFVIEAGTPHSIGQGILLVEPQHVAPGRVGVTYRYGDFGRRYDAEGRADPNGQPRPLHVKDALAVTRWDLPRGEALFRETRTRAGAPVTTSQASLRALAGPGGLASDALLVSRLAGTGALALPAWDRLRALTVLEGHVEVGALRVPAGRTAALPAAHDEPIRLVGAHALLAAAR